MPRLEACHFGTGANDQWPRMARVLAWSAKQQLADWTINVRALSPTPFQPGTQSFLDNTRKLAHWAALVAAADEGEELLLIDGDTLILRPLDDIWGCDFDLAYTTKAGRFPFNAGVIFVRVTPAARAFMAAWVETNALLLRDQGVHRAWRVRYGGMNQAALGYLLERRPPPAARLLTLPCATWNCEDATWPLFDPKRTRILHIKSALRRAIFGLAAARPHTLKPLMTLWQRAEQDARAAEGLPDGVPVCGRRVVAAGPRSR